MANKNEKKLRNNPWRPVVGYLIFGILWIYFSDTILAALVKDPEIYQRIQTYKGLLYVALTGLVLYFLIQYDTRKIHTLAYNDSLTRMKNRVSFESEAKNMIAKGIEFTVFLMDVNDFKHLNEVHGHHYGDKFLKQVAKELANLDVYGAYRWWGDQFLLILKHHDEQKILKRIKNIQTLLGKEWVMDHVSFNTSVSLGVSSYPQDCSTFTELSQNLDVAIYKAKEKGKEQYVIYSKELLEEITYLTKLEHELKKAIAQDMLTLYCQPIVDLKTEEATGYEILLRWFHKDSIFANIGKVIQAAEKTQQISAIDRWVIDHLFKSIYQNPELKNKCFAVNVSSVFFTSNKLQNYLLSKTKQYDIDPSKITLEVTEYSIIQDFEKSKQIISEIKNAGFKLSLDDFGTKYSSLGYLSQIPFDVLKIDKTYIDYIHENDTDKAIVNLIAQLGRELDLTVVGEGIEYAEQRDLLIQMDCHRGQGYYFAKPMPLQEVIQ